MAKIHLLARKMNQNYFNLFIDVRFINALLHLQVRELNDIQYLTEYRINEAFEQLYPKNTRNIQKLKGELLLLPAYMAWFIDAEKSHAFGEISLVSVSRHIVNPTALEQAGESFFNSFESENGPRFDRDRKCYDLRDN